MVISRRTRRELRKVREKRQCVAKLKNGGKKAGVILTLTSMLSSASVLTRVKADDDYSQVLFRGRETDDFVFELIEEWAPIAAPIARDNGLYPSVMLAQALLESLYGNGLSQLVSPPYYNLFGIKGSYNGESVKFPTQEWTGEQYITIAADFRRYPSYVESFEDNAKLLRGWDYYASVWRENALTFREAAEALQGRYATSPTYASSLIHLIELYGLDRFDDGEYEDEAAVYVHRLYNPNNGFHHYTTDEREVEHLKQIGWIYEGRAFRCSREGEGMPLYRLYNEKTGHHLLTTNSNERDWLTKQVVEAEWKYEGIAGYVKEEKSTWRVHNPNNGDHLLVPELEAKKLVDRDGWDDEGTAWWSAGAVT